jgi:AAA+ ATPase superfamily predicted ATPase
MATGIQLTSPDEIANRGLKQQLAEILELYKNSLDKDSIHERDFLSFCISHIFHFALNSKNTVWCKVNTVICFALNSKNAIWCKMDFIGRKEELRELELLTLKKSSSLVTVQGRRRIGKSTLIEEFAKTKPYFYEFQGLAPRKGLTKQDQLNHFADQIKLKLEEPISLDFNNWTQAFEFLSKLIKKDPTVILFDEISWMASSDADFVGKLKTAWDTSFKKHSSLILVLCGSVSSWIEYNILNDTDFMGRVSLSLHLKELPLNLLSYFWGKSKNSVSSYEMLELIAITGGIPRYLEELKPRFNATQNIEQLCYHKSGLLFSDFAKIFNDIFDKRAKTYKNIVKTLTHNKLNLKQIASKIKMQKSGTLSHYLADLVLAGFLEKAYIYNFKSGVSKITYYRICDNYLRFYLRLIEPFQDQILNLTFDFSKIRYLAQWEQTMGYQFESTLLNNTHIIFNLLGIQKRSLVWAGSFIQVKNSKNKGGCQIDFLIHTKEQTIYVCEFKFRKRIGTEVIQDVKNKIKVLKCPRYLSIRKVLIYEGGLVERVRNEEFFDYIFNGDQLFNVKNES